MGNLLTKHQKCSDCMSRDMFGDLSIIDHRAVNECPKVYFGDVLLIIIVLLFVVICTH